MRTSKEGIKKKINKSNFKFKYANEYNRLITVKIIMKL